MSLRLALIDNDSAVLDLLTIDLSLEGHEIVAIAEDGEVAVQVCEATHPDVVIVDLRLGPGIDGLEVARRVIQPGRRVVLHTNYVTPAVVQGAERIGAVVVEKGSLRALRRAVTESLV